MINNLSCTHVVQLKLRDGAEFPEFKIHLWVGSRVLKNECNCKWEQYIDENICFMLFYESIIIFLFCNINRDFKNQKIIFLEFN